MQLNDIIYNFSITNVQKIEELSMTVYSMVHKKSGAKLTWYDRNSTNKTFGIGFRTTPEDDTGIFHILEHSVLNGSKKFPIKGTIVELMKSSMQTFLNAYTSSDFTCYPVSSKNDRDYMNLSRVYTDLVLNPLIYDYPEIFWQEGWHYEQRKADEMPSYKGIVLNEMKGAMSEKRGVMEQAVDTALYPDNCYCYNSGGEPKAIPNLSYEQFINAHRRFYHPSNAMIVLDGSVDINAMLKMLDEEYLFEYDAINPNTDIAVQKPICTRNEVEIEIAKNESEKGKAWVAWGWCLEETHNAEQKIAMEALTTYLCGENHSPLKKAFLDEKLCKNLSMHVNSRKQTNIVLCAEDTDVDKADAMSWLLTAVIGEQAKALDREKLLAILINQELRLREKYSVDGLSLVDNAVESMVYGTDVAESLNLDKLFASLKAKLNEGWFEKQLESAIIESKHFCRVTGKPSSTAGEARKRAETQRLQQAKASWSEAEQNAVLSTQARLDAYQSTPNTAEQLKKLPRLELSEIDKAPEEFITVEEIHNGIELLYHPLEAAGVAYGNIYHDISDFSADEISDMAFICSMLGKLDTKDHSSDWLNKQLMMKTGKPKCEIKAFENAKDQKNCRIMCNLAFDALEDNFADAYALIENILKHSIFEEGKVANLLSQSISDTKRFVYQGARSILGPRIRAGVSQEGVVEDHIKGVAYLMHLNAVEKAFDKDGKAICERLCALAKRAFAPERLCLSIGGGEKAKNIACTILDKLDRVEKISLLCTLKPYGKLNEGFIMPVSGGYAMRGGHIGDYSGKIAVASQIISKDYLWNAIRTKGGAYGGGLINWDNNDLQFYSYRDPNCKSSLNAFENAGEYIKNLDIGKDRLDGFIIGTVAESEIKLLPYSNIGEVAQHADDFYFRNISHKDRCRIREEMLSTKLDEIADAAKELCYFGTHGGTLVAGEKELVETCDLDKVYTI